jgi:hypothetical protein
MIPAEFVSPSNFWFVALLTAVTFALGTIAPDGSTTVAEIDPVAMPCEKAEPPNTRHTASINTKRHRLLIASPPFTTIYAEITNVDQNHVEL